MARLLRKLLEHPLARGAGLDDAASIGIRRRLIQQKLLLRRVYEEWYGAIVRRVPPGPGVVLELGSGPGFLGESIADAVTSDVQWDPMVDMVLDGRQIPLTEGSVRAVVMINVLHHISDVSLLFESAARVVRPGGAVVMIEPWVTGWSRFVYSSLHHEPFEPGNPDWSFPLSGPLSGANGALPWMVFARDREVFQRRFPQWTIESIEPIMPFIYLVSGGTSMRSLAPAWSYRLWRGLERFLTRLNEHLGMFAIIVLRRDMYFPSSFESASPARRPATP